LRRSDEQRQPASGRDQASGGAERPLVALDSAQGDEIRGRGKVLGPAGEYIDARQCERAHRLFKEDRLLLAGLDQREREAGGKDLQRQSGEAGAGAQVDGAEIPRCARDFPSASLGAGSSGLPLRSRPLIASSY